MAVQQQGQFPQEDLLRELVRQEMARAQGILPQGGMGGLHAPSGGPGGGDAMGGAPGERPGGGPGNAAGAGGPGANRMRTGMDGRTSALSPFPSLAGLPPSGFPPLPQGASPQAGFPAAFQGQTAAMPLLPVAGVPAAFHVPTPMVLPAPGVTAPPAGAPGAGEEKGSHLMRAMAANLEKLRAVLQETEQIAQQMEDLLNQESRARSGGKHPGKGADAPGAQGGDGQKRGSGTRPLRVRKA